MSVIVGGCDKANPKLEGDQNTSKPGRLGGCLCCRLCSSKNKPLCSSRTTRLVLRSAAVVAVVAALILVFLIKPKGANLTRVQLGEIGGGIVALAMLMVVAKRASNHKLDPRIEPYLQDGCNSEVSIFARYLDDGFSDDGSSLCGMKLTIEQQYSFENLIEHMMDENPKKRPNIEDAMRAIRIITRFPKVEYDQETGIRGSLCKLINTEWGNLSEQQQGLVDIIIGKIGSKGPPTAYTKMDDLHVALNTVLKRGLEVKYDGELSFRDSLCQRMSVSWESLTTEQKESIDNLIVHMRDENPANRPTMERVGEILNNISKYPTARDL